MIEFTRSNTGRKFAVNPLHVSVLGGDDDSDKCRLVVNGIEGSYLINGTFEENLAKLKPEPDYNLNYGVTFTGNMGDSI